MAYALYRCRTCGESYVLSVMRVLETIRFGSPMVLGGAPHGTERACKGKIFDLVGDTGDAA